MLFISNKSHSDIAHARCLKRKALLGEREQQRYCWSRGPLRVFSNLPHHYMPTLKNPIILHHCVWPECEHSKHLFMINGLGAA